MRKDKEIDSSPVGVKETSTMDKRKHAHWHHDSSNDRENE